VIRPSDAMFHGAGGNDGVAVCSFILEGNALARFRRLCDNVPDFDHQEGRHLERCLELIFRAAEEKYCQE